MLASYHVHSVLSDGRSTILEHVRAAVDAGLDELGISDHYVLLGDRRAVDWSMPLDGLEDYFEELRAAVAEVEGKLVVRYGLEADYDPETVEELGEILRSYPLDYVIGSVHYVDGFTIDASKEGWARFSQRDIDDIIRAYWDKVLGMARSELFDFVGHLDLYKKFGHRPSVDVSWQVDAVLDVIAQSEMAVELNTAGWHKDVREAYPSPEIVRGCFRRSIPMLVTADAHHCSELTRDYERGTRVLREAGYSQKAVYAGRRMRLVELD